MVKPANWISATGTSPATESPTDAPTIADSAIGMSKTRLGPNRSRAPSVARNTPPLRADVLAEQHDPLVARHLVGEVSRIADSMVMPATTPPRLSAASSATAADDLGACRRARSACDQVVALACARGVGSTTWSRRPPGRPSRERGVDDPLDRASTAASARRGGRRPTAGACAARRGTARSDRAHRHSRELVVGHVARRVVGVGVRAHPVGDELEHVGPSPARRAVHARAWRRAPRARRCRRRARRGCRPPHPWPRTSSAAVCAPSGWRSPSRC